MLDICLPGTGGMIPLEHRWLTCCWMEYQGNALLIDCGEGTQIALKKAGCKLSRLNTLLITHYHADHIAGLPGLLLTVGNTGKTSPLAIVGPGGLGAVVSALTVIAPVLPYPLELYEAEEQETGGLTRDGMTISFLPLRHSIRCLGYRVDIHRKPIFNPEKAAVLGIPPVYYKNLHRGETVEYAGNTFTPDMVLDGLRDPLRVTYFTDTQPVKAMAEFARDSDLLISEGMYGDDSAQEKMEIKGHMIFSDSARLACQSGAKRLWLTHYSPAMPDPTPFLQNARDIYPDAVAARDGQRLTL